MMGKRLYKTYRDLSNIVVRVSNGTAAGKAHAILVNAHLDSTLPSPGAADDALSCGVLMEAFRVMTQTPGWSPKHAMILREYTHCQPFTVSLICCSPLTVFNNAEESLQDGSHLYSTQDPSASSVRAVINLEAAGSTGPELLFQATSEQMIVAHSRVPRPLGTVMANEIFSSGILLSE
jgi:Zn-dependent M28 family amino/carboxypeptidase